MIPALGDLNRRPQYFLLKCCRFLDLFPLFFLILWLLANGIFFLFPFFFIMCLSLRKGVEKNVEDLAESDEKSLENDDDSTENDKLSK